MIYEYFLYIVIKVTQNIRISVRILSDEHKYRRLLDGHFLFAVDGSQSSRFGDSDIRNRRDSIVCLLLVRQYEMRDVGDADKVMRIAYQDGLLEDVMGGARYLVVDHAGISRNIP